MALRTSAPPTHLTRFLPTALRPYSSAATCSPVLRPCQQKCTLHLIHSATRRPHDLEGVPHHMPRQRHLHLDSLLVRVAVDRPTPSEPYRILPFTTLTHHPALLHGLSPVCLLGRHLLMAHLLYVSCFAAPRVLISSGLSRPLSSRLATGEMPRGMPCILQLLADFSPLTYHPLMLAVVIFFKQHRLCSALAEPCLADQRRAQSSTRAT